MINKKSKYLIVISIILLTVLAASITFMPIINDRYESTAASTLYINNINDLNAFRDNVNGGNDYSGTTVYLNTDITFDRNNSRNFTEIGFRNTPFRGTFDGQGHKISGFRFIAKQQTAESTSAGEDADINKDNWTVGFFGHVQNATIRNLWLDDYEIWAGPNGSYDSGTMKWDYDAWSDNNTYATTEWVGGLIGLATGNLTLSNILATNGDVTAVDLNYSNWQNAGGLIGYFGMESDDKILGSRRPG